MGKLWQELVESLRQRPLLWLPVLLADLLGYLLNLGRNGLVHAVMLHQTAQRSALGGQVVHGPLTASALQTTTIAALLISWLVYFLRVLLYSAALFAMAGLLEAYRERRKTPAAEMGPTVAANWGHIFDLALRAIVIYAVAALLASWITSALATHGHVALLRNPFLGLGLGLLVLLALAFFLPPVAIRLLSGTRLDEATRQKGRSLAVVLVFVAALFSNFVGSSSRQLAQAPAAAKIPLEIIGSLVAALPYVLLYTGICLLARHARLQAEQTSS